MAARCDEEVAKSVFTKCIQKLGYLQLKPEQLKVIMEFVNGRDVFAVCLLVTGKLFVMLVFSTHKFLLSLEWLIVISQPKQSTLEAICA